MRNGRLVTKYGWQGEESHVVGYSDSDWEGCQQTGRSTSGGVIMVGDHFIKGWSRTESHVTNSSAEAELIALVESTSESLGIKFMAQDWGHQLGVALYAESSPASANAIRQGAGKLRHKNASALWIQDITDHEGRSI